MKTPKRTAAARPQLSEADLETHAGRTVAISTKTGKVVGYVAGAAQLRKMMDEYGYKRSEWRPFTVPRKAKPKPKEQVRP